jgi:hypothetical protein
MVTQLLTTSFSDLKNINLGFGSSSTHKIEPQTQFWVQFMEPNKIWFWCLLIGTRMTVLMRQTGYLPNIGKFD